MLLSKKPFLKTLTTQFTLKRFESKIWINLRFKSDGKWVHYKFQPYLARILEHSNSIERSTIKAKRLKYRGMQVCVNYRVQKSSSCVLTTATEVFLGDDGVFGQRHDGSCQNGERSVQNHLRILWLKNGGIQSLQHYQSSGKS